MSHEVFVRILFWVGYVIAVSVLYGLLRSRAVRGTKNHTLDAEVRGQPASAPVRPPKVLGRTPAEAYFATHRAIPRPPVIPFPDEDDNLDLDDTEG